MKAPRRPVRGTPGRKLTPGQVEAIVALWPTAGGNASEVARQVGCSRQSVERYVVRLGLDEAGHLYARALARGQRLARTTMEAARRKVVSGLGTARGAKAIADLTRAACAVVQTATAAQLAHAKITGALVEKHEVNHSGNLVIHLPAEETPAKEPT